MTTTTFDDKDTAAKDRGWLLVDAQGKTLGRLATEVADLLRGKNKPTFAPHLDTGDFVVVINASGIVLSGNKAKTKIYKHHTGYAGGVKEVSAEKLREENPERMIRKAVLGMVPSGPLGRRIMVKLKVYSGAEHPHAAQQPKLVTLKYH